MVPAATGSWSPRDIAHEAGACRDPRAKEAALSRRFIRVRGPLDLWVYLGGSGDYIVVPGLYCSCPKFQAGARSGSRYCCHHLAGLPEAVKAGRYHEVEGIDQVEVVREVLAYGRSYLVRRALFAGV